MQSFEKLPLGIYPTPMYKLENLSAELGTNVWIKRDDLCGIALGGNKVRKLRYLLADAKAQGYDLVMTTGAAQSNHATLTAACAGMVGLDCVLVLMERGVTARKGNQILNHLMGVEVVFVDTDESSVIYEEMDRIAKERGKKVYKIPCGGSNAMGVLGYVDCMKEVAQSGVAFDYIVSACGSGGTCAGNILGAAMCLPDAKIVCATVDFDNFEEFVPELVEEAKQLLEIEVDVKPAEYVDVCGPGYSIPSEEGNEAIALLLRTEGILLDTCYTGKAFAGLVRKARAGEFKKDDNVLFIHTGGAGGLFAQDWENM